MVAGGLPSVQVLLDNNTGAFPYDITAYVRLVEGYALKRGRQDELADTTPGDLALVLDNTDGRFTLGSTLIASPSPVVVDQRLRLRIDLVPNTTFETNVVGYVGSNATLARSTAQAHTGGASMSVTAVAAATSIAVDSGAFTAGIPVMAGVTYPVEAYARAATVGRSVRLAMDWWDSAGVFLSTTTGSSVVDTTTGWTLVDEDFVAPPNAAFARRQFRVLSPAAGEVHYVDDFRMGWNRHTGFVQQWPVAWPDGSDQFSLVSILSTDAQARGEGRTLRSVIEEEIMDDAPTAYYTLGEPAGSLTAADSSGNQAPALLMTGAGTDVVFGNATGPGTDGLTAAEFADGKYLESGAMSGTAAAVVCAFSTIDSSGDLVGLAPGEGLLSLGIGFLVGPLGLSSPATVNDGATHVAELQFSGATASLLLDGVVVDSVASALAGWPITKVRVGSFFTGTIAHVSLFTTNPGTTRGAAHSAAMLNGFAGESGTARLTRLAGYANLPLGTLDTSLTNVAFEDITDKSASAAVRDVVKAEMGLGFYDGSGNLTFHNRNRAPLKTAPDITIDANQLDPGTQFIVDKQGLLNYYKVTAAGTGVTQVVRNTVSELGDGTVTHPGHNRYPGQDTYLVLTDAEALDRGNWVVSNHAEPAPRLGQLVIDVLTLDEAAQTALLTLEPDTWIRVTNLPGQTPGGTTADFMVQGFAEKVSATEWTIAANVVNRSLFQAWILGDTTYSVLGSTTKLYV
jgi:hypothetical protein